MVVARFAGEHHPLTPSLCKNAGWAARIQASVLPQFYKETAREKSQGGSMAHYGTLRDFRFSDIDEATDDIRGAKVYGLNEDIWP